MSNNTNKKKLTLIPLILMIFTSVFGFANMPRAFYLMGYSAIPWYLFGAITFVIPYAFMVSEYGAAFKDEKGGIYSWMAKSIGPRYAFVGTFMWFASYVIWMVSTSSSIWIPFSNAIFGSDMTSTWHLFGLNPTQTIGILGIGWIILVTIIGSRGLDKIKKVTGVAGTVVALLNVVLILGAILIFILNKGQFAQPITSAKEFLVGPNPAYGNPLAMMSFAVFAIFAFGGIEVVGGLVDESENPTKTFPKAITLAAIIIAVAYAIGIFVCGMFTNWDSALSGGSVNMANVAYVLMKNFGVQLGLALGTTAATAATIGIWVARFVGLSMFIALTGAFFTLTYSPVKQLIEGTPKEMWPTWLTKENKAGMPIGAMAVQCVIVAVMIFLTSFGGENASEFFSKLVLMTNVAMTIPNIFIAGAFYKFKKNKSIEKPFELYKSKGWALVGVLSVVLVVGLGNIMTIIEPVIQTGDWESTLWMIAGPIIFTIIALIIFQISKHHFEHVTHKKMK
ncbi:MAG: glutamate/gamma-aminobutyrate family transporter YjeM [Sarcina sp.]